MTAAPRTEAGRVLRRLWADHNRRISHGEYPRRDIWDRVTADLLAALADADEPAVLPPIRRHPITVDIERIERGALRAGDGA